MSTMSIARALTPEQINDIVTEGHVFDGGRALCTVPCDLREAIGAEREFFVGAEVWTFDVGAERGIAVRCVSGRGAMTWNADTTWGDWDGPVFATDDGSCLRFDECGNEVDATTEAA